MTDASIMFGAIVPPIAEQLAKQGLGVTDTPELERIQLIARAISTVKIHGMMTPSAADRAYQKCAKRLWKIVAPTQPKTGSAPR